MNIVFLDILFLLFSLFILGRTISYGLYEIKAEKNLFGGFSVIIFSSICILFCNIVIWFR